MRIQSSSGIAEAGKMRSWKKYFYTVRCLKQITNCDLFPSGEWPQLLHALFLDMWNCVCRWMGLQVKEVKVSLHSQADLKLGTFSKRLRKDPFLKGSSKFLTKTGCTTPKWVDMQRVVKLILLQSNRQRTASSQVRLGIVGSNSVLPRRARSEVKFCPKC